MSRKKILAGLLILALVSMITPVVSMNVSAAPYAEINIAESGVSKINATDFDTEYGLTTDTPDGGRNIRPETDVGTEHGGNDFGFEGNVGWMDQIEWLQWTINVAADGFYRFNAAIASDSGNGGIDLYLDGEKIGSSPDGKEGNGWQDYTMYVIGDTNVSAGTHILRMESWSGGGINIAGFDVEPLNEFGFPPVWENPNYRITRSGTTTIKATDFDPEPYQKEGADGAQQVREGHAVRTEGNGSEWGSNIGWIAAGDWVQYTVNVASDGVYSFVAAIASDADPTGGVKITVGDAEVGTSANSAKNGWQEYDKYPVGEVALTSGEHVIKVEFTGGVNFAAIEVTRTGDIPSDEPEAAAPPAEVDTPADGGDEPGDESADDGETPTTPPASSSSDDDGNMILWIIVAVVAVVIIVVIIIFATKKKKA